MWLGEDRRRFDHFRVHMDALSAGMGAYEFVTYCALIAHAEVDTGRAYPSVATIASYFGIGERRVRHAVAWLEEHGWVTVDRIQGLSSRYRVLPPPTPAPHAGVRQSTHAQDAGPPRHHMQGTPACGADELEPENENQRTRTTSMSDAFGADVERLCVLLAELIEANGCKRPNVTEGWRKACDRMLRIDKRTPEQVENAIRWCQADPFWRANVLSMPKLREKYDQLRLAAKRPASNGNGNGKRPTPADRTRANLEDLFTEGSFM